MVSTVTTATVVAVTAAAGRGVVGALGLVALLMFMALFILREAVSVSPGSRAQLLVRGLTIGLVPLGMAGAVILMASLAQALR